MVLPIITSVTREIFSQVPREHCEAALALGGTRSGMIRRVMLPFARGGIIGGTMLGLGRALGETIAVSLLLSFKPKFVTHILHPGGSNLAALIVTQFPSARTPFDRKALIAAGLALFALTFLVNLLARVIVVRTSPERVRR